MNHESPALEALLQRLAATPEDFLAEPSIHGHGVIHVEAVVHDIVRSFGQSSPDRFAFLIASEHSQRNLLSLAAVLAWLMGDPFFVGQRLSPDAVIDRIQKVSEELSAFVNAQSCVDDPERREETVRLMLSKFQMRPAGETQEQAQDRLTTISSRERSRVVEASRRAQERAKAIREALARKAAEEAADKWTRE
ncbi:MAG: hypothetical protein SFY92_02360 [Verrucomicrobiae bacterium]|nr:hypothetical protein [Verrucomicrobiae bacterium]